MRLYRFIKEDDNIDVTVVTDGVCNQKKIFITEIRGISAPGNVTDKDAGAKLLSLGFNYKVGHVVMHEELVAFAENKGLELEITPQGLNEIVSVEAKWTVDDVCVLTVNTTVPVRKEVMICFPNTVTLNESVERYGEIRGDRKELASKVLSAKPMEFTLEDLGLADVEDLNIIVMADDVQKFELTAEVA